MRADAAVFFQLQGVQKKAQNLEFVIIQSEKSAQSHVVDASFLRAMHGGQAPGVILLGAAGMHYFVGLVMIGFLEQDNRADACIFQLSVFIHFQRRDFHIDPSDFSSFFGFTE